MPARPSSLFWFLLVALLPLCTSIVFGSFYVYHEIKVEEMNADDSLYIEGSRIFAKRCLGCHMTRRKSRGPTLIEINANAAKRKPGLSAEQYMLESIMEPSKFRVPGYAERMPDNIANGLSADEIRAVIYYIQKEIGEANEEKIANLKITPKEVDENPNPTAAYSQINRGRKLFEQKAACVKCHLLNPEIGFDLMAPSIMGVGLLGEQDLHDAVFVPSKVITNNYEHASILMPDGTIRNGRILHRTEDSITILEINGQEMHPATINLKADEDGEQPEVNLSEKSSMPDNYKELLTPEEQADLLAFLRSLVSPR